MPGRDPVLQMRGIEKAFVGVKALDDKRLEITLDARGAERLHAPSENPAAMSADPDDVTPDDLGDKLRRAWHVISGNY